MCHRGTESPPPDGVRSEVFIDTSNLAEMIGISRLGGRVIVGVNTSHSVIAHASLIRMNGTCLAEACEGIDYPFASLLLYDFRSGVDIPPTLTALAALDAEIESAWLDKSGSVERRWCSLDDLWNPAIAWGSRLLLSIRYSLGSADTGSAVIFAAPPPGTTAHLLSAAARLSLDDAKSVVADVKIVLAPKHGAPFSSPGAAALLRNHPPDPDRIELAAHAALLDAQPYLPTPTPESAYRIDLAAYLTRQALDRSLARALRDPLVGRL